MRTGQLRRLDWGAPFLCDAVRKLLRHLKLGNATRSAYAFALRRGRSPRPPYQTYVPYLPDPTYPTSISLKRCSQFASS